MSALAWLLPSLPLCAGAALACTGRRGDRLAPAAGVAVAAATLGLAVAAAVARPQARAPLFDGIDAALGVDGLSAVLVLTVAATTLAVLVFAAGEFGRDQARARFFGLMLLFAGAMLVAVTAETLALLLMGWEAMGATSWALIGYWWREPRRVEAAHVAFLTTRAADVGLYLAAGAAVAGGVGGLALASLPDTRTPWLAVVAAGVVAAALGKSAQLPFSFWLSRAMEGPSPVSALLHSATMVAAGGYLLLRLQPLLAASDWSEDVVAWTGAATALALGLVAVAQRDLKQVLAASTCSQIGFIVLAAGAGGVAGGTLQLVAHAATKSLLFLAAGAWLTALGTKQLPALRGAARRYRLVGVAFTAGAFALAGLPPAALWAGKDEVLAAALARGPALYAVGLAAAVVSAVYSAKAAWYVWQPVPADAAAAYDEEREGTRSVAPAMRPPLVALALFALGLGALALPPLLDPLQRTLGAAGEPSPRVWEFALAAGLAVAAAAAAWTRGGRPAPLSTAVRASTAGWLGLGRATSAVGAATLRAAAALAAFDDRVVDRAVRAAAGAGVGLAALAYGHGERAVDGAVGAVAGGARRLGSLARRPQTGQLHQYYAQAAAALAVLAVFLVLVR
jgi:NADH:ubiquinone oxidoreductase subunit 5 (subunit L)/multisubunit Na+/H+ antiporter MnhA subunit